METALTLLGTHGASGLIPPHRGKRQWWQGDVTKVLGASLEKGTEKAEAGMRGVPGK